MADRLRSIDASLYLASDDAKTAEDFLRNLLGAHGRDARVRIDQHRWSRWSRWTDRERMTTAVVGGDQLRRARLAVSSHAAAMRTVATLQAPEELAGTWNEMIQSLSANIVDDDELAPDRLPSANSERAELIGSLLHRVLAAGSAVERTRVRIMLAVSRAAAEAPGGSTL